MLRTLATALQEGGLSASSSRRLLTKPPVCTWRRCFSDSLADTPPAVGTGTEKPKKTKRKAQNEPIIKSVLQESKLRQQLDEFERPGQAITLEDVERYRPTSVADPAGSDYAEWRKMAQLPLEKSFNKSQLYDIAKLYGIKPAADRTKRHYASLIMEKWGWVTPEARKVVNQSFPLKASEAFLVMQGGQDFLELSRKKSVKLSLSRNPLSLQVKGPQHIIEEIGAQLRTLQHNEASRQPSICYHRIEDGADIADTPLYSVLPFSPSQARQPLNGDVPTYRIARVHGPLTGNSEILPIDSESVESLTTLDSKATTLRQWLNDMQERSTSKVVLEASPGHILMSPVQARQFSVTSPLPGEIELQSVTGWLKQTREYIPTFFSWLPKSIYSFHTTSQNIVERLVYSSTSPKPSGSDALESVIHCDLAMKAVDEADGLGSLDASCSVGWTSHLDVLIPDRASDLRFTAYNLEPLSDERCPTNLKQYIAQMHEMANPDQWIEADKRPQPPLTIFHGDQLYVLTSMNRVRTNVKERANETGLGVPPFEVTTETVLDAADSQSMGHTTCKISCDSDASDIQWDRFLRHCQWLTRGVATTQSPPLFEEDFSEGL
ncbi:hypothetical protein EST38_g1095 [Candolleomyces aberdarensis]|uniref:Uncharacterized protein n=1 Tax=Candolleomyces aberdarensis TaxID=2316362 RepID=A0A4Q2DYD5_9AGAR|nr:hypothetical protein EST38_g1095 [Candolleomyces aberdarensis]